MGRRARERKERREAGRERAMGASGGFMEDHDGQGGYIMARDGWRRRGADTAAYARQLRDAKAAAEKAFHREEQEARTTDPAARAADDLVANMLGAGTIAEAPAQAVAPPDDNTG